MVKNSVNLDSDLFYATYFTQYVNICKKLKAISIKSSRERN